MSSFQSSPEEVHWTYLKNVLRYVKGTIDYEIIYKKQNNHTSMLILERFADANWANQENWRSIAGYMFRVYGSIVCWSIKRQPIVVLSTTKTEYMAASRAACNAT